MDYLIKKESKTLIRVYVVPGSAKSEFLGCYGEPVRLKIKIAAPPEDGKANEEILALLAKTLGLSKNKIEILRGHTSKQKDVLIDLPVDEVQKKLLPTYKE